jgi:hypothetical protein
MNFAVKEKTSETLFLERLGPLFDLSDAPPSTNSFPLSAADFEMGRFSHHAPPHYTLSSHNNNNDVNTLTVFTESKHIDDTSSNNGENGR